jgi:phospholipase C
MRFHHFAATGTMMALGALVACGGEARPQDGAADAVTDHASTDVVGFDGALDATVDDAVAVDSALDASTDGDAGPVDVAIDAGPALPTPIRYVVVIVKENHTFDNLFYGFPGVASPAPRTATLSDGSTLDVSRLVAPFDVFPYGGLDHSHARARRVWHGGAMDRFNQAADGSNLPAHGSFYHYPESQVRNYWQYARHFVLCDNFFATTLAPSAPGHIAIVAAQSIAYGNTDCPAGGTCERVEACDPTNDATMPRFNPDTCDTSTGSECFTTGNVIDNLPSGLTWRTYGSTPLSHFQSLYATRALHSTQHNRMLGLLLDDLQRGDQANLTLLDISGGPGGISEHPDNHPCAGESFTVEIINRIMRGPHWNETVIVVTYDDWGGWYDHVAPHVDACPAPNASEAFNTGFRLPAMVISPYSRRGTSSENLVFHTRVEQASVTKLIEELLHDASQRVHFLEDDHPRARDRRVNSLMGTLDFTQPPRAPLILTPRTDCPPPAP